MRLTRQQRREVVRELAWALCNVATIGFVVAVLVLCTAWGQAEAPAETAQAASADSGISPGTVGAIVAGALGSIGAYKLGTKAVRVEPQPLEVAAAKEYATRQELQALQDRIDSDIDSINRRIDNLASPLAEIKGKMDVLNQNQKEILSLLLQR